MIKRRIGTLEVGDIGRKFDAGLYARLGALINTRTVSGSRYSPEIMAEIDTEEPCQPDRKPN